MKLSVILITWNAERYVDPCLKSLLSAVDGLDYEILLVDNGSSDETRLRLDPFKTNKRLHFFAVDENLGVAKARNIGLRAAKGDRIWILDIDTVVNQEALIGMLDYMRRSPECGICGCKLVHTSGEVQDSCRRFPFLRYKIVNVLSAYSKNHSFPKGWKNKLEELNRLQFYKEERLKNEPFEVDYLIGACQMIRREVVEKVGELDENIFYGPEDADYCLRTNRAGWKICYLPYVSFIHDYQRATNRNMFTGLGAKHLKALLYFWWKYKRC